ncbi:hypothetical protein [Variovorax atrisoli]|uniref:hypothetical protein n=1 Tax=Variovorax atrisoli TaxID=3394203 RepID=UPI00404000F9
MADSNVMTIPEFSAHLGYGRTYAYQLRDEGRLVMTEDGKRVLVAESIARIEATKDPARQGVAARHAAQRAGRPAVPAAEPSASPGGASDGDAPLEAPAPPGTPAFNFQVAKAKREHFAALEAEAAYRARMKELLEAADVRAALVETMTILRTSIEGIAHRLAPALAAEVDEGEVRALLDAEIRHALSTAAESLAKVGR